MFQNNNSGDIPRISSNSSSEQNKAKTYPHNNQMVSYFEGQIDVQNRQGNLTCSNGNRSNQEMGRPEGDQPLVIEQKDSNIDN